MLSAGVGNFCIANNLRGLFDSFGRSLNQFGESLQMRIELLIRHTFVKQFVRLPSSNEIDKECYSQAVDEVREH